MTGSYAIEIVKACLNPQALKEVLLCVESLSTFHKFHTQSDTVI